MSNDLITALGTDDADGLGPSSIFPAVELSWRGLAATCERSLWVGDVGATEKIAAEALRRCHDLGLVFETLITPSLRRIGDLWEPGHALIDPRQATDTALQAMRTMRGHAGRQLSAISRRVVLATVTEERHTVGLRMAADVLTDSGHEAVPCSPGTSLDAVVAVAHSLRADAVALSCTNATTDTRLRAMTDRLWDALPDVPVLVGGRGLPSRLPDGPIERIACLDGLTTAMASITPHGLH